MKYHFLVHEENGKYWAECKELIGCLTQGENLEDLKQNAAIALNLFLDEPEDSKVIFALPKKNIQEDKNILEVKVEPQVAFSFLLRQTRIAKGLTQKAMAKELGIENIYSYQRLERRSNPTLAMVQKIKNIIPDFPIEAVF